jgi:hypothetical protein
MKRTILLKKIKKEFKSPKRQYYFGKAIHGIPYYISKWGIHSVDLGWKDKFNSPRFECVPSFHICLFGLQFCIWWRSPDGNDDDYYEMILWWLMYCNEDIVKAENTWSWIDCKTNKSTWNRNYLL